MKKWKWIFVLLAIFVVSGCSQGKASDKKTTSHQTGSSQTAKSNQFGDFFGSRETIKDAEGKKYRAPKEMDKYVGTYSGVQESEAENHQVETHTELKINKNGSFNLFTYDLESSEDADLEYNDPASFYIDADNHPQVEKFEITNQNLYSGIISIKYGELSLESIETGNLPLGLDQTGKVVKLSKSLFDTPYAEEGGENYTFKDNSLKNADSDETTKLEKDADTHFVDLSAKQAEKKITKNSKKVRFTSMNDFLQQTIATTNYEDYESEDVPELIVEDAAKMQKGMTEDNKHPAIKYAYAFKIDSTMTNIYATDGKKLYRSIDAADQTPLKWETWDPEE